MSRPRTVLHFTDAAGFGGAERALLQLLGGLNRSRWRSMLLHHPSAGVIQLRDEARCLGVRTMAVPAMPPGANGLSRLPHFVRLLRALRPSVFHAHLTWPLACKYGLLAAMLARVPAIIATVQLFVPLPYSRWDRAQQRLLAHGVGRYIAVSRSTAARLHQAFGTRRDKLSVVHNAVTFANHAAASPRRRSVDPAAPRRPQVLAVARLDPQKGLDVLVDAATLLPEVEFQIAGDGTERANLLDRIHERGLDGRVRLLGDRRDVPELLAACDAFVLPSRYEGLPLSALEAMAAGAPVVATSIPGTDEAVVHGQTGLLVPPDDPVALATTLRTVLHDQGLAERLRRCSLERVRRDFSVESMVAQVSNIYDAVLEQYG